jgi:D-glycero-alpha-D-manno-heptose 1-phosphate guanylyltransferase
VQTAATNLRAGVGGGEAIVLAGGRGTRLTPVLPNRQKVTADVAGVPFVLRVVHWLRQAGMARIVLAAGHRAGDVEYALQVQPPSRTKIIISAEPHPLGTAGATRRAASSTTGSPVLVVNGDSFAEIDPAALLDFHQDRRALVSLGLVPVADVARYGTVETGVDDNVLSFTEKSDAPARAGWINAGVYVFDRAAFDLIPADRPASLERELFPILIGKGLFAARFDARFIDIGTPESLAAATAFFAESMT